MPLYRHAAMVLQQEELAINDLTGRVWRIRPAEGDAVTDPIQEWRVQIVLKNEGGSSASVVVQTSYDREIWVDVASATAGADAETIVIPAVDVLAPFIRAKGSIVPLPPDQLGAQYRTRVRLVSNGPFKLEPT
jgi:hypothetical protein